MDAALNPSRSADFARTLFSSLPRRYDRLGAVLSLGQDRRWRRTMIDHIEPDRPARVLDVATGPAGVALELVRRTDAAVTGVDLSWPMLDQGRRNVAAAGCDDRVRLVLAQGERLPFRDAAFDAVAFTYLLRYVADPAATIGELARVVKPGGTMASLEFGVPPNRFWRWWWRRYTAIVLPIAAGLLGGRAWFDVGRFLGPNIADHYRQFTVADHVTAWESIGMSDVGVRRMSLGGGLVMWGRRIAPAVPE